MDEIWQAVETYRAALDETGELARKRAAQATSWMWREIEEGVVAALRGDPGLAELSERLQREVAAGRKTPATAAAGILAAFRETPGNKSG